MSINILHVSDLHFGTNSQKDKESTRYNEDFVFSFISQFDKIKIDYLIVSGDVANKSATMEYNKALKFLNKVVDDLNIPKKNVIICMGNHDISWDALVKIEDSGKQEEDLYKEKNKYINFKKFYNNFYKDNNAQIQEFNTDPVFVTIHDDTHKILLLGVNTCFHESNKDKDHYGYIEKDAFNKYVKDLETKYKGFVRILVMHHNPSPLADEQHNVKNWRELNFSQIGSGLPCVVFCGHMHKSDGESTTYDNDENDTIHYISVGSLLKKSTIGKYNLYTINDNSTELKIKYYNYQEDTASCKQYWQEQTNIKAPTSVFLRKSIQNNDTWNVIASDVNKKRVQDLDDQTKTNHNKLDDVKSKKSILDIIKDQELYYSGHFHWDTDNKGENSKFKSHGYIDINYLVSHNEALETIISLFKTKIEEITSKITLGNIAMVSIGLECDVIGARLSVLFPKFGFSYIPLKHKENDHNDVEKEIGLTDYDTVILIKDITFDADEAIEIIEERFKDKNVYLISLFYCGKKEKKNEILSGVENAHFYSLIDDIEIPQCDMSESECPIIKNKLQTIYRC